MFVVALLLCCSVALFLCCPVALLLCCSVASAVCVEGVGHVEKNAYRRYGSLTLAVRCSRLALFVSFLSKRVMLAVSKSKWSTAVAVTDRCFGDNNQTKNKAAYQEHYVWNETFFFYFCFFFSQQSDRLLLRIEPSGAFNFLLFLFEWIEMTSACLLSTHPQCTHHNAHPSPLRSRSFPLVKSCHQFNANRLVCTRSISKTSDWTRTSVGCDKSLFHEMSSFFSTMGGSPEM